jgi:hypothetical protein
MDFFSKGFINESEIDPRLTKALETFFGQESRKKDFGTEQFLADLYSYPPKITVYKEIEKEDHSKTRDLSPVFINDTFNSFLSTDKFATSPHTRFPGLDAFRPLLSSEPKVGQELSREIVPKRSYSNIEYLKGYLNKKFTSSFLINYAAPLKLALETTPVYVVLNGQNDIVLAHETNFDAPPIPKNRLYDICGAFADNGTLKMGKLGFVFFSYKDAKAFMDAILESEPDEAHIVGLALHCVSLSSAYELMRNSHPGIDFRFIPNLGDLESSSSLVKDSRFLFQEDPYELKSDSTSEYGDKDLADLNKSPLQNPVKGVPVYMVQLRENKRDIVTGALRFIISKADSLTSFLARPHKLGRRIMRGQLAENQSTETYLFFDYRKALDFCKKKGRFVVRLPGSYVNSKFGRVVKKPIIFATDLETLLEKWENGIIFDVSDNKSLGSSSVETREIWNTIKFVPVLESEKSWDAEEIKSLNSPVRKMCLEIKVRYRILTSFLQYVWFA